MEDNMSLLDKVAYPAFAKDPFIRPSARAFGAVLVAFNDLSCIRWLPELRPLFPHSFVDPITPVQIVIFLVVGFPVVYAYSFFEKDFPYDSSSNVCRAGVIFSLVVA